jgi:hypothetical protein
MWVTLFFLKRKPIPFVRRSETCRERFTACAMSVLISFTISTPNSFAWPRCVIIAALSSSAFVGMHPMFRQTPPRNWSSTHATL